MYLLVRQRSAALRGGRLALLLLSLIATLTIAIAGSASASSNGVFAWGENEDGQLGDGSFAATGRPVMLSGLGAVTGLDAGSAHSLAVLSDGTAVSWGANADGQLGNGKEGGDSSTPAPVNGLSGVTAVSAGGGYSMALLGNGTVMAWGANGSGQLGNGTTTNRDVPVPVSGLSGVTAISAGDEHGLALLSNGTVMAWGSNFEGQLGNGTTKNSDLPMPVPGLTDVMAISAGGAHSMALLSNGTVKAWGWNIDGQLGNGSTVNSDVPLAVSELSGVAAISAGLSDSVALLNTGTVMTWGNNDWGELGRGSEANHNPRPVEGLGGVTAIAAGGDHDLVSLGNGAVMAWGQAPLGDGTPYMSVRPVTVLGLSAVSGLSAGAEYSSAYGPPTPTIANVTPHSGSPAGGSTVTITGTNFTGATAVKFGANNASSFAVDSPTSITAVSPAGSGTVDVTVRTPEGLSAPIVADRFRYVAGAPEFGRCIKVAKGTGKYKTANCTSLLTGGSYEWTTEILHKSFTTKIKAAAHPSLQFTWAYAPSGPTQDLACQSEHGTGEYSGVREVANVIMTFTGCKRSDRATCSSEGAASGEIVTNPLEGVLGIESITVKAGKEIRKVGLDLYPAGGTGLLFGLGCVGTFVGARGSVIGNIHADATKSEAAVAYKAKQGVKQLPEQFEGEPKQILEGTVITGEARQMGLKLSMTQSSEEAVEVNAFF